jgi:hypothetical protein
MFVLFLLYEDLWLTEVALSKDPELIFHSDIPSSATRTIPSCTAQSLCDPDRVLAISQPVGRSTKELFCGISTFFVFADLKEIAEGSDANKHSTILI